VAVQGDELFEFERISVDGNALAAKEHLPLLLVHIQEQLTMIARNPLSPLSRDGSGEAHEKTASAI